MEDAWNCSKKSEKNMKDEIEKRRIWKRI